jgi:hypothetical protein
MYPTEYEESATKWVQRHYPEFTAKISLFKIKDTIFPSTMFGEEIVNLGAQKWWNILSKKSGITNNLKDAAIFFSKLHSVPASSASLEKLFSTYGNIWSDKRNKLSPDRVQKLVKKINF